MRAIHYAGEDLLTGSLIADAVLNYAQALAQSDSSDTVDIPVVGSGGAVVSSTFLLGPASQLVAVETPDYEGEELEDSAVVARLDELASQLSHPIAMPVAAESIPDGADQEF